MPEQILTINAVIKANAKHKEQIQQNIDGSLTIRVKETPQNGKANKAVIKLLSKHYKVTKSNIRIISGRKSKYKIIQINNV